MTVGVAALALALQQASVTGVVRDSIDLEPVAFARIVASVNDDRVGEALSDRYGAFVLAGVPAGPGRVEVRSLRYETWTLRYDAPPAGPVRILMRPAPLAIEGVVAEVDGSPGNPLSVSSGSFVVDQALVRAQPVVLEVDLLRAAAVSPAASSTSDWTAIPYVRGGAREGTPVLLDGVRLFNPFHAFGLMSALNGQTVSQAKLITGSADDGQALGSLSGAFDVVTRDGARDRFRMSGSLGLASVRLAAEGPVGPSTSYLVDAEQSHIHWTTAGRVPPFFGNVHAKATRDLGGVGRMSLTAYASRDRIEFSREGQYSDPVIDTVRWSWGNAAVVAHYRHQWGASTLVDANVGHSRFRGGYTELHSPSVDLKPTVWEDFQGSMRETRADLRATHSSGRVGIQGGLQAIRSGGSHESTGRYDRYFSPFRAEGARTRIAGYANVGLPLGWGTSARVGLRVDRFLGLETTLAPFAKITYAASQWSAWASGSRSHQALFSVRDEETGPASLYSVDALLPVERAPVPRSTDAVAGWEGTAGEWRLRLEAYARWMDNLRLVPLGGHPLQSELYKAPASRVLASGTARGVEASWSWIRTGRGSVVGSYRWGKVTRTVRGIRYTPRFHRDHEMELSTALERGSSLWSLRFSGRTGQPTTRLERVLPYVGVRSPQSSINVIDDDALVYAGQYNAARLPRHVRIDVGWRMSREVSWFGGGTLEPFASIANLFSVNNVVAVRGFYYNDDGQPEIDYLPQLPMFPFFGVEFRF